MTDAWMVRSIQRNSLLSEMHTKVIRLEDKCDDRRSVQRKLIEVCMNFLSGETTQVDKADSTENLFFQDLLPGIKDFSRAEEETNVLVSELLVWLIGSFTQEFRAALMAKEIHDPKTIFHASSATENVQLEE